MGIEMSEKIRNNYNIKLVVSDLDGTLLDSRKRISRENLDAIKELREKGILFTICTGRIATMIEPYVKALGIDIPIITTNGAVVWDPANNKAVADRPMDREELLAIIDYCDKNKLEHCLLTLGRNYFSNDNFLKKRFDLYNTIASEEGMKSMELEAIQGFDRWDKGIIVYKMLIYSDYTQTLDKAKDYLGHLKNTAFTSSGNGLLDIMNIDVNKGKGVEMLARALGLGLDEVCAFGDYDNDISMLEIVGLSVAMDNALPGVKSVTDYVTKSNDEHGVAKFIKSMILC